VLPSTPRRMTRADLTVRCVRLYLQSRCNAFTVGYLNSAFLKMVIKRPRNHIDLGSL
jgi:hypothetical protein